MKQLHYFFAASQPRSLAWLIALIFIVQTASFTEISAQCFESDGMTVRPSYYNIMIAIDDSWVDNVFNGDLEAARISANFQIDKTIEALNAPEKPFANFFKLSFKKIFFPTFVGGPNKLPGESTPIYSSRLFNFYNDKYSCVPFDCVIYFTSDTGTDHNTGANGVVITPGNDVPSLAHEIGHTLGLSHLGVDCCATENSMMCDPPKMTASISPQNTACGFGVAHVNTAIFTPARCATLDLPEEQYEDDLECPPTGSYAISIAQSNPNPVINCKIEGDINTVSVIVFNGYSQQVDLPVRVFIGSSFASTLEFVQDPNLDFNCIKTFPSKTEFWITDANCGNETNIPICAGCSKTLKFKVRYLGGLPPGANSIPVTVALGTTPYKTLNVTPVKSIQGGNFSSLLVGPNPLLINGTLVMDNTTPFEFGRNLLFASGAALEIKSGSVVNMTHIVAEGCSTMWKGITVRQGGILNMSMMTSVKDAQIAINVQKGGTANIQSCEFEDNNFAISTSTLGSGNHSLTLLGNTFQTSDAGLKPPYTGQSPAPGTKGFAGIYVKDLVGGLSIDKDAMFKSTNEFHNLNYGILAENTGVILRDALFTNILKETRPPNYPGPINTGTAIYLKGGSADIKGNYGSVAPDPVVFDNCHTGINVFAGSINVGGCEMDHMTNGIVAGGGANRAYSIFWNNVTASERGVLVSYQAGLPGQSSIDNNLVRMLGNANGIGISTGGQEMFPQQEGFVHHNHITIEEGATGIQVGVANRIKVTQNNVNLLGSGTLFGIKMEAGDQNTLNCNSVSSTGGSNDGIYAIHASRASVLCNISNGPARGLHFEGMLAGKNKANIGGNVMESNADAGLLLGTDAVTGEQVHRGNKWIGTEALAGATAPTVSKFIVDAGENPDFIPDSWLPALWFDDISTPSSSFDCGASTSCPAEPVLSDYPLDIKIVKGQLGGSSYQAANQWLSQRRFYERVIEDGNPYPGNSDVSTFLSQAQSSGLSAYAYVQTGIRQLGAMTETARATAVSNLLTMNSTLTGSASYQVNEKAVNTIFLQTVASGYPALTSTQTASLASIAAQCPLSGGEAVLRARALLDLNLETPVVYNDAVCYGQRPSGERFDVVNSSDFILRVYPNPASEFLTLEYNAATEENSRNFLLFDIYGRLLRTEKLPELNGSVQISTENLPDGVYSYSIAGMTGKVVIQH